VGTGASVLTAILGSFQFLDARAQGRARDLCGLNRLQAAIGCEKERVWQAEKSDGPMAMAFTG